MANRNRRAGHGFERKIVQEFNHKSTNSLYKGKDLMNLPDEEFKIIPKLGTTRRLSRALDAKKIDIAVENREREKEFPYLIQAKSSVLKSIPYVDLLKEIKDSKIKGIPVVFHQKTKQSGSKFMSEESYACMYMDDFIDLIIELHKLKKK